MKKYRVIGLTQGFVAVIDAEDFRRVNRYSWQTHRSAGKGRRPGRPYARGKAKGKMAYLHRFILKDVPEGMHVDHINRCTLDCRKENLEIVTHAENHRRRRIKK